VKITAEKGDLTELATECIVNPANSYGLMGGGVAHAIKKRGGQIIEDDAKNKAPTGVGAAVVTTAGQLAAKHVIHAPTMEKPAEKTDAWKVRKYVKAALECAEDNNFESMDFPGMGCGVGGLSYDEVAEAMLSEIMSYRRNNPESRIKEIILVGFTDELTDSFIKWKTNLIRGAE